MNIPYILLSLAATAVGGLIGYSFGAVQDIAFRRNTKRQAEGTLNSGWAVMPGSFKRIAYLMTALLLVQIICPLLFTGAVQWFVSGGVVLGYGWVLYRNLAAKRAARP